MLAGESQAKDEEIARMSQINEELQNKINEFMSRDYPGVIKDKELELANTQKQYSKVINGLNEKLVKKDQELVTLVETDARLAEKMLKIDDLYTLIDEKDAKIDSLDKFQALAAKKDQEIVEIKNTLDIEIAKSKTFNSTMLMESDKRNEAEIRAMRLEKELGDLKVATSDMDQQIGQQRDQITELESQKDTKDPSMTVGSDFGNLESELSNYLEIMRAEKDESDTTSHQNQHKVDTAKFAAEIEKFYEKLTTLQNNYRNHNEKYIKNNQELSLKIQELTNELSELRKENTFLTKARLEAEKISREHSTSILDVESRLLVAGNQKLALEKEIREIREKNKGKSGAGKGNDKIAGDLLKNLLETEKGLNKTKFERDKLSEELLKTKKDYSENISL
jgi:hypothetical protein